MVGLEALRKSDLFEGLGDEELLAIARLAREEKFDAGSVIFREKGPANYLYIVREGRVAILIDISRGKQAVIDTIYRVTTSVSVPPVDSTSVSTTTSDTIPQREDSQRLLWPAIVGAVVAAVALGALVYLVSRLRRAGRG